VSAPRKTAVGTTLVATVALALALALAASPASADISCAHAYQSHSHLQNGLSSRFHYYYQGYKNVADNPGIRHEHYFRIEWYNSRGFGGGYGKINCTYHTN
jgi:hypothetical protein